MKRNVRLKSASMILLGLATLAPRLSIASEMANIEPIGEHVRLFRFEKNENPQNILIVYGKIDSQCHFKRVEGQAFTDFYWLMDGVRYKAVNSLIMSNIRDRIEVAETSTSAKGKLDSFDIVMTDLKSIDPKLDNLKIQVSSTRKGKDCVVATDVLSNDSKKESLRLDSVFSESEKTLLPPFRKLISLTLRGTNTATGLKESRVVAKRN